jgi:type II secretory pathway pseudopilin PulG
MVSVSRARSSPLAAAASGGTAGYSLVVLIMAVTVLNIMLAVALPKWSEMIKRDKEEELISRGFQYVEAIRVFQKRYQRFPITLDELIKVKPRCIRQLWKDPMTDDGNWTLIFQGQGSPIPGMPDPSAAGGLNQGPFGTGQNPGQTPGQGQNPNPNQGANPNQPPGNGLDPSQPLVATGPIVGVRSRSTQKSLLEFFGHEHYNEWEFRIEMFSRGASFRGVGAGGGGGGTVLSTRWLGRPMPGLPPGLNGAAPPSGLGPSALGPGSFGSNGPGSGSGSPPGGTPPGGTAPPNPGGGNGNAPPNPSGGGSFP